MEGGNPKKERHLKNITPIGLSKWAEGRSIIKPSLLRSVLVKFKISVKISLKFWQKDRFKCFNLKFKWWIKFIKNGKSDYAFWKRKWQSLGSSGISFLPWPSKRSWGCSSFQSISTRSRSQGTWNQFRCPSKRQGFTSLIKTLYWFLTWWIWLREGTWFHSIKIYGL